MRTIHHREESGHTRYDLLFSFHPTHLHGDPLQWALCPTLHAGAQGKSAGDYSGGGHRGARLLLTRRGAGKQHPVRLTPQYEMQWQRTYGTGSSSTYSA